LGRTSQFRVLSLVFTLVAVLSLSACVVASAPTSGPASVDRTSEESPDPTPAPEIDETLTPEPTAEPVDPPQREQDNDASDDTANGAPPEPEPATDDEDDQSADEPEETAPGNPVRLQIDSIDVDAPFEYVGVTEEGNMDVPQEWDNVAWYEPGTIPGDRGNAVVAGHYDSDTGPAVFIDLNELAPGDEIRIVTEDDEVLVFEVTEVESVHVDDADTRKIFGSTDERNLNLITCEGVWDPAVNMYDQRLIVYSTLVSE
jgi:sortase A